MLLEPVALGMAVVAGLPLMVPVSAPGCPGSPCTPLCTSSTLLSVLARLDVEARVGVEVGWSLMAAVSPSGCPDSTCSPSSGPNLQHRSSCSTCSLHSGMLLELVVALYAGPVLSRPMFPILSAIVSVEVLPTEALLEPAGLMVPTLSVTVPVAVPLLLVSWPSAGAGYPRLSPTCSPSFGFTLHTPHLPFLST